MYQWMDQMFKLNKYLEGDANNPKIVAIGTCNIHTMHINYSVSPLPTEMLSITLAIAILPNLSEYINGVTRDKIPTCSSFHMISLAMDTLKSWTSCFARFVKPQILVSVLNISGIDLAIKEILLLSKDVDLGYAVRDAQRETRDVKERVILEFINECQNAMVAVCSTLIQRSPLKFILAKGILCLDSEVVSSQYIRIEAYACVGEF
ncbi:hypothetical protein PR048_022329 [Dryococelus australis]|uniref:Uncharacterized protein n=1 Tax=Dryococelus australis TaxID=614101 RepID=A0ABQ9H0T7_9NEOP|nr:hypothetical protein PR048_022329 [Dryococelus australis]